MSYGEDSGGGGGGGGGSSGGSSNEKVYDSLADAAKDGKHGQAVKIKGKGLQKVEFADEDYDQQMANVSANVNATGTSTSGTSTSGTVSQPSGSIMDGLQHTTFEQNIAMALGLEEKTDGWYADQLITLHKNGDIQGAINRANFLKQSGLMNDVSLVDKTISNLQQGGSGFVPINIDGDSTTPISASVQSEKTFDQAFAEARAAGQSTFSFDRDGDGVPESYTTELASDSTEQKYNMFGDRSRSSN